MSSDLIEHLLALPGRWQSVRERQALFHRGDPVTLLYVLDAGEVDLERASPGGSLITMQRCRAVSVIAEASVFSDRYHCDARALSTSQLYAVTRHDVITELRRNLEFSCCWNARLATEVQSLRMRNEILGLRTVRDRLDAWLAWTGQPLPPKGQWHSIASDIGVSSEALYRELASRKRSQRTDDRQGTER